MVKRRSGCPVPESYRRDGAYGIGDLCSDMLVGPSHGASMAGRTKRLAKAAVMLATSAAVQKAVRKAAADPRVRKQAAKIGAAARATAVAAGKAAGKRAARLTEYAGRRVEKKLRGPRKTAGKKIRRVAKIVAG